MEGRFVLDTDKEITGLVNNIKKSSNWLSGLDPAYLRFQLFNVIYTHLLKGEVKIESAEKYLNMVFDPAGIPINALFNVYRRAILSLSGRYYLNPKVQINKIADSIKKILDNHLKKIEEKSEYHHNLCEAFRYSEGCQYEKNLLAAIVLYSIIVRGSKNPTWFFTRDVVRPEEELVDIARNELESLSYKREEAGYQACLHLASFESNFLEIAIYYNRILDSYHGTPRKFISTCSPETVMSLGDFKKQNSQFDIAMTFYKMAALLFLDEKNTPAEYDISIEEHPSIEKWIECIRSKFANKKNIRETLDSYLEVLFFYEELQGKMDNKDASDEVAPTQNRRVIAEIEALSEKHPEARIYLACYQCYQNTAHFKQLIQKIAEIFKENMWPEVAIKQAPIKLPTSAHQKVNNDLIYLIELTLNYYFEENRILKNKSKPNSPFEVLMRAIEKNVHALDELNDSVLKIYGTSRHPSCDDDTSLNHSEKEKTETPLNELKTSTFIATAIEKELPFIMVMEAFNIDHETNFENILLMVEAFEELRELPGYDDNILAVKIRFKEKLEAGAQAQNIMAQYALVRFKELNPDSTAPHEYTDEDAIREYRYLEQVSQSPRASLFTFRQVKDADKEKVHRRVMGRLKELAPSLQALDKPRYL